MQIHPSSQVQFKSSLVSLPPGCKMSEEEILSWANVRGSKGSKRTFSFLCFFKIKENLSQKHQSHPNPPLLQANLALCLADPSCFVFSCLSNQGKMADFRGQEYFMPSLKGMSTRRSVDLPYIRVLQEGRKIHDCAHQPGLLHFPTKSVGTSAHPSLCSFCTPIPVPACHHPQQLGHCYVHCIPLESAVNTQLLKVTVYHYTSQE